MEKEYENGRKKKKKSLACTMRGAMYRWKWFMLDIVLERQTDKISIPLEHNTLY